MFVSFMAVLSASLTPAQDPIEVDWAVTFDHPNSSSSPGIDTDYPATLVAGADNSTFMAGRYAINTSVAAGWFVEKVDRDGQPLWSRDAGLLFPNERFRLADAAADGIGGVVCVGTKTYALYPGHDDIFLLRFDGDGNLLWETFIGDAAAEAAGAGFVRERASSIVTDGAGGFWIGGESIDSSGYVASLFRIDGNGQEIARFGFSSGQPNSGVLIDDLEPDGAGGVYCLVPQGFPIFSTPMSLLHVNPSGAVLWQAIFDSTVVSSNFPIQSITTTTDGHLVVSADDGGLLGQSSLGTADAQFVKVDSSSGAILWSNSISFDVRSKATDLAPSPDGGVYVTGVGSINSTAVRSFIARLSVDGELMWSQSMDATDSGLPVASGLNLTSTVRVDRFGIQIAGMTAPSPLPGAEYLPYIVRYVEPVGARYCSPAVPNSTGASATLLAEGSSVANNNQVLLSVSGMPSMATSLLVNSPTQGLFPGLAGGQGTLCLGGPFGRYVNLSQSSNGVGRASYSLDLTSTPTPTGIVSVMMGDVWNFQVWYRDANPTPTSNLSDAVSITFM